jgi:hypothetical protein
VLLGAQPVGFGVDRDVIRVGGQVGQFESIALKVNESDVFVREISVVYANGERDRMAVNANVPAGASSPEIRLKGDRFIREIELLYQARPSYRGRAVVEVYGNYSDGWLGDRGRRRDFNQGWVMLGAQRALMFSSDSDNFEVSTPCASTVCGSSTATARSRRCRSSASSPTASPRSRSTSRAARGSSTA